MCFVVSTRPWPNSAKNPLRGWASSAAAPVADTATALAGAGGAVCAATTPAHPRITTNVRIRAFIGYLLSMQAWWRARVVVPRQAQRYGVEQRAGPARVSQSGVFAGDRAELCSAAIAAPECSAASRGRFRSEDRDGIGNARARLATLPALFLRRGHWTHARTISTSPRDPHRGARAVAGCGDRPAA